MTWFNLSGAAAPRPSNASRALSLFVLAGLVGCDGIGRAIVDELGEPKGLPPMCSDESPECDNTIATVPATLPPVSVPLGLESCASTSSPCTATPMEPGSTASVSYPNAQSCTLELAMPAGDFSALRRASCTVLSLLPVPPASLVRMSDVSIEQTLLTLKSDVPVVVELVRSRLVGTRVTLVGPVTLRMVGESSLQDVWVQQQPWTSGAGAASFELIEGRAQRLTVGQLEGHVDVTRSVLLDSQLWANDIVLEGTSIARVFAAAESFDAVELNGSTLTLQVGRGTLSHVEASEIDVQRCRSMLVSGSRVSKSKFAACTEKLRVDYTMVANSMLLGSIESNIGTWIQNAFGVGGAATDFEQWGGSQLSSRYCPGVSRVSFAEVTTLECNVCDQLPAPETKLCPALPFNEDNPPPKILAGDNPRCPMLADVAMSPPCSPAVRNELPF